MQMRASSSTNAQLTAGCYISLRLGGSTVNHKLFDGSPESIEKLSMLMELLYGFRQTAVLSGITPSLMISKFEEKSSKQYMHGSFLKLGV